MSKASVSRLQSLSLDRASRSELNERCGGGFFRRHQIGPIHRILGGWQYGYEIEGYGTVLGYCRDHRPHKTRKQAAECGARYEAGRPPRFIDTLRKVSR